MFAVGYNHLLSIEVNTVDLGKKSAEFWHGAVSLEKFTSVGGMMFDVTAEDAEVPLRWRYYDTSETRVDTKESIQSTTIYDGRTESHE